jgi:hypothetical protein
VRHHLRLLRAGYHNERNIDFDGKYEHKFYDNINHLHAIHFNSYLDEFFDDLD